MAYMVIFLIIIVISKKLDAVKRIPSGRVLAAGDGNAADAPLGNGFERNTVVEAKSWPEPTNAPTAW
jgi:hypothetical protein